MHLHITFDGVGLLTKRFISPWITSPPLFLVECTVASRLHNFHPEL